MLACYGKTRQGMVEKEMFVMPSIPSSTLPVSPNVNVSSSPQDLYGMLLSDLEKKIDDSHLSTQNVLLDLTERMDRFEKGKSANIAYSTNDLTFSSATPPSTTDVEYGMPPNCFAGQTPPPGTVQPPRAEPARPVASTGTVRPAPQRLDRSDRSIRPVKPVLWCWPRCPPPHSRQWQVRLPLAE